MRWLFVILLWLITLPVSAQRVANTGPGQPFALADFLYYHVASSTNPVGSGIVARAPVLPNIEIQANDTIVLGVTVPHGTTISITDTLGLSWPAATCTADGGTGNYTISIYAVNVGSSPSSTIDSISLNVGSTDIQPIQYVIDVFANLATSSVVNNSLCTGNIAPSAGGLISPGSFTPTTNNDANGGNIIWNYTALCGTQGAANPTNWVPATGFTLLNGDIIWTNQQGFPWASQWETQLLSASVTPSITATGDTTNCYNSASMALKVNNNGTGRPAGIHVVSVLHESCAGTACGTSVKILTPMIGNLRVITATFLNATWAVSGITSSDGCNYTKVTGGSASTDSPTFYAQNCSSGSTVTATLTTGAQSSGQISFRVYDIQNAAASSFDVTASNEAACGTTFTGFPTITPASGDNLTITQIGNGNGPITAITNPTSPAPIFDLWLLTCTSCTLDSDLADNADYTGHQYSPAISSTSWNGNKTFGSDQCYGRSQTFK